MTSTMENTKHETRKFRALINGSFYSVNLERTRDFHLGAPVWEFRFESDSGDHFGAGVVTANTAEQAINNSVGYI